MSLLCACPCSPEEAVSSSGWETVRGELQHTLEVSPLLHVQVALNPLFAHAFNFPAFRGDRIPPWDVRGMMTSIPYTQPYY